MASNELTISAITPHAEINAWLRTKMHPNLKYTLTIKRATKKRTLDQNGQLRVWYEQIAKELPEDNLQGWERYCKLHHGVPILRADDEQFRQFYDKALKGLDYEFKLKAMDYTPVTRLMITEQFNRYFEALQDDFLKRGVSLEFLRG